MKNPKPETRNPKEIRSLKSDQSGRTARSVLECGGWRGTGLAPLWLDAASEPRRRRRRARPAQSKTWRYIAAVSLLVVAAASARAQNYNIDWHTIDGGGGASTNGQYAVSGTIGQPDAGAMAGGNYAIQGGFWSAYMAVQTAGAPTLTIRRVGDNVELSWPADDAGFTLEETASLNPTITWLGAGTTPVVAEGRYVVTLPLQAGPHFFRLRKPPE